MELIGQKRELRFTVHNLVSMYYNVLNKYLFYHSDYAKKCATASIGARRHLKK